MSTKGPKGGAGHTTKPQVDTGLLYKIPVKVMPLIKGLIEEATSEIHGKTSQ